MLLAIVCPEVHARLLRLEIFGNVLQRWDLDSRIQTALWAALVNGGLYEI
jgi:hypothetical protein